MWSSRSWRVNKTWRIVNWVGANEPSVFCLPNSNFNSIFLLRLSPFYYNTHTSAILCRYIPTDALFGLYFRGPYLRKTRITEPPTPSNLIIGLCFRLFVFAPSRLIRLVTGARLDLFLRQIGSSLFQTFPPRLHGTAWRRIFFHGVNNNIIVGRASLAETLLLLWRHVWKQF